MTDIKVPEFGESIQEVQISTWYKQVGEWVNLDDDLVELESEKASQPLPSPIAGLLKSIARKEGEFAEVGDVIAVIDETAEKPAAGSAAQAEPVAAATAAPPAQPAPAPAGNPPASIMPAAERLLAEHNLQASQVAASGPGGRLLKEDVIRHVSGQSANGTSAAPAVAAAGAAGVAGVAAASASSGSAAGGAREETVRPMSMIRRTIARRLVEAQQTAALLTTFNESDMQPVMSLRKKYKEAFAEKHGVKLGFMSFFCKAVVEGLKRYPAVNSEIRGNEVVYRNYFDIGVAIGGGKGLVVPALRSVERMSFAEIEQQIGVYAKAAMENRINPEDLVGGTFTISNGGVYGSLLSTPIVNPPQSGILGLHSIQERPIALNGEVVIRPMMYIALTYDHRIIDGKEAVQFLKTIKDVLEEPARLFLEV